MRLAEPYWLFLLVLAPLPWIWSRARARLRWPSLEGFAQAPRGVAGWLQPMLWALRGLAVAGMVVALARPQVVGGQTRIAARGVAIVVVLDHSSSMDTRDFPADGGPLSRLEAAKQTVARFVTGRADDLIGLVVFANLPDLACPPTLDRTFLLGTVRSLRSARPGDDGTNIGDALVWGLNALRATTPKKKVLILLTDGENCPAVPDPTDPEVAARLARELGVTLHTIAVGRAGGMARATEPITGLPVGVKSEGPDLELLKRLAELGGGRAFAADEAKTLDEVFHTIDALEKSPIRGIIQTRYDERFQPWVALALGLLVLDRLLASGRLRPLP
jgi:Ca-activated chloride channel family protein